MLIGETMTARFPARFIAYSVAFALLSGCVQAAVRSDSRIGTVPPVSGEQRDRFFYPLPYPVKYSTPVIRPIMAIPRQPLAVARDFNATGRSATAQGVVVGPDWASLGISHRAARSALLAFRTSCPSLLRRADRSGLTQNQDWAPLCAAANSLSLMRAGAGASDFFAQHMRAVQIGDGKAYSTGYYEPEIRASYTRRPGYEVPIYRRPPELTVALQRTERSASRKTPRQASHKPSINHGASPRPYYDRSAIEQGALHGRGLEIAYAADPVDFFFLQIQGSGRLRFPDGSSLRIGYAGSNGHRYVGIGGLLRKREQLTAGYGSMQGLKSYLRANPKRGAALMKENPSWIFFREIRGPGPIGALGVPVTGKVSLAVDPSFIPLGAPVFLSMNRAAPNGLWIAQDIGSAIKGTNRVDSFWGTGPDAGAMAGGMSARGTAFILLPRQSVLRLIGPTAMRLATDSDSQARDRRNIGEQATVNRAMAQSHGDVQDGSQNVDAQARQAMQEAISKQLEGLSP